jgi:hypothetical protein
VPHDVLAQLIALDPQRDMRLDILDWIVAGVGIKRVDSIHPVYAKTTAIAALHDFHINSMLPPSDVYFGRDKAVLQQRERIKRKTLEARRLHHSQRAA